MYVCVSRHFKLPQREVQTVFDALTRRCLQSLDGTAAALDDTAGTIIDVRSPHVIFSRLPVTLHPFFFDLLWVCYL
jgi:hypothetical protein